MISRGVLTALAAVGAALPIAIVVVLAVARLLVAMQDTAAGAVLDWIALGLSIVWAIDLIALILALALRELGPPPDVSDQ